MKTIQFKLSIITLIYFVAVSCSTTQAQSQTDNIQKTMELTERTIEVTGSAEMQIEPNVVKLKIILSSNHSDKKKEFYKLLNKNGIKDNKITIESMNKYNWWWYYNHSYNHSEQTYMVTIDSTVNAIQLMQDLKQSWIRSVNISEKTNTKLQQYRKDVKIEAIKAAKEKATYLLAALDEEISSVITIIEINNDTRTNSNYWWNQTNNVYTSNSVMSSGSSNQNTIGGISMDKVRYEVKIVFGIK